MVQADLKFGVVLQHWDFRPDYHVQSSSGSRCSNFPTLQMRGLQEKIQIFFCLLSLYVCGVGD